MKTNLKRFFVLFIAFAMILPTLLTAVIHAEAPTAAANASLGMSFDSTKTLTVPSDVNTAPITFEAVIHVPKGTGRAGVIMGNYSDNIDTVCFEIHENGKPRLYAKEGSTLIDIKFNVDIRSDDYVHLAIAVDTASSTAICYVNGVDKDTQSNSDLATFASYTPLKAYMIGGDCRGGNAQYFKGAIRNVAFYSDLRTNTEIASDAATNIDSLASVDKNELVAAYDLTKGIPGCVDDLSGNGHTLSFSDPSYDQAQMASGLTFSATSTYRMPKTFKSGQYPVTLEATMFVPGNLTDRIGVIMGNYAVGDWSMTFEILNGHPRVYVENSANNNQLDLTFDELDVRTGDWAHVALVFDTSNNTATCYLNGENPQTHTINKPVYTELIFDSPFYLGRDTRSGNESKYFKGALKSAALYSDARTAEEIKADMSGADLTDACLIAAYEFSEDTGRYDISGNGYHFYFEGENQLPDSGDDGDEGGEGGGNQGGNQGGEIEGDNEGSGITTLDGFTFTSKDYAIIQKSFKNNAPLTFEATILVPKEITGRAGVILGNHSATNSFYLNFEIHNNGNPRLCFTNPTNISDNLNYDYIFEGVKVNTGEVVHLAITVDPSTGVAYCYVNGKLKQYIPRSPFTFTNSHFEEYAYIVGNDSRPSAERYFLGTIGSVSLFSDVRTAEEIADDAKGIDVNSDNIIMHHSFAGKGKDQVLTDATGNGYDIKFQSRGFASYNTWIGSKEPVTDYLYSFAIVGDTQIISRYHPDKFDAIYSWILNNQTNKNIQYVFGLGDITDSSSSAEWDVASSNIFKMNGIIPYSAVRGNHDTIASYNAIFAANAEYMSQFDGFYSQSNVSNSYRAINIYGVDYLMLTLDYGASDSVLEWAADIIESYPNHKVIITTHAYLYRDGTTLDQGDVCPPATNGGYNNGDHMWDKLISQHENICLVISGHDPSANVVVTQTTGVHGNLITQMLVDPQGVDTSVPTGMVTMLYFKADGSIEVETYSTIQEMYYKEANQFVIEETEHAYSDYEGFTYENGYLMAGTLHATCTKCGYSHGFATEPLFVFSGYSIKEDNTAAICVGYTVNLELLAYYEEMNGTSIDIGITAAAYDNLVVEGAPINPDGTSGKTTNGIVVNYKISKEFKQVCLVLRSKNWEEFATRRVVLCAYYIENGKVYYICDTENITEKAGYVTYGELLEK